MSRLYNLYKHTINIHLDGLSDDILILKLRFSYFLPLHFNAVETELSSPNYANAIPFDFPVA